MISAVLEASNCGEGSPEPNPASSGHEIMTFPLFKQGPANRFLARWYSGVDVPLQLGMSSGPEGILLPSRKAEQVIMIGWGPTVILLSRIKEDM